MHSMFAVLGLSGGELILVLTVILVLFGARKIPDFAKGLGQGIKEFKKASREVQDEIERAGHDTYAPPPPPPPAPPVPAAVAAVEPGNAPAVSPAEAASAASAPGEPVPRG